MPIKTSSSFTKTALKAKYGFPIDYSTFELKSKVLPVKGIFNSQFCNLLKELKILRF